MGLSSGDVRDEHQRITCVVPITRKNVGRIAAEKIGQKWEWKGMKRLDCGNKVEGYRKEIFCLPLSLVPNPLLLFREYVTQRIPIALRSRLFTTLSTASAIVERCKIEACEDVQRSDGRYEGF